jgi:hypothetical protein
MKIKHLLLNITLLIAACGISSCDDFLDTMPDQRTELDNMDKVRDILISAYPGQYPMLMFEFMSDNYDDNGDTYSSPMNLIIESYYWKDAVESDQDSPNGLWNSCYRAIAAANQALEAIEELGDTEEYQVYKGEALLCRAYGHFLLSNIFCMGYNSQTAASTLGIPYITAPEKKVGVVYDRQTLQHVYEMIDADIEKALPLIRNAAFDVPLYHFNPKAAYAFAARFNLFYGKNYDKVIEYANEVLGDSPLPVLRDLSQYDKFTTMQEWTYGYINKDEPANLMLLPTISRYGRAFNQRYAITQAIMRSQLVWSLFPGGKQLEVYNTVFQSNYVSYIVPKMAELFEITNQIAQTGFPHIVVPAFTTDETLLCRAEAYVLKKEYDKAATDLSYWYVKKGIEAHSSDEIADFYKASSPETNAKPLNTGVNYDEKQTNMLHAVLHARRVESIHEGGRWMDIKRYGISITHNIYGSNPIVLKSDDPRKAIQLPIDVLAAPGKMTPNPR